MSILTTDRSVQPLTAISLSGVTKSFGRAGSRTRVEAVRGVDLDIHPGEIVAFLGPNGAGKTTTIDMMLGLTQPDQGTVTVLGQPPREAVSSGRVSAVLQTGGLLRDLSVRETIRMIASTFEDHSSVDDVMARAGLEGLGNRKVSKCSGGEQQRLRFALALLPDPDVLILDEPTAGMDVSARRDFWASMHAEAAQGRTVVFATHYLEEADAFADRIVLIASGSIVADGTTQAIRARATGRSVSADLPSETDPSTVAAQLRGIPEVGHVSVEGHRICVLSGDSDAMARLFLTELGARNLEVAMGSLETAFITITGESAVQDTSTEEAHA
ncbi:MAG: ABC transporter ATP-binding protein [Ornithinimicrobium sp.]